MSMLQILLYHTSIHQGIFEVQTAETEVENLLPKKIMKHSKVAKTILT
jgi:hypothetical protein